jgi:hypothetical protein
MNISDEDRAKLDELNAAVEDRHSGRSDAGRYGRLVEGAGSAEGMKPPARIASLPTDSRGYPISAKRPSI